MKYSDRVASMREKRDTRILSMFRGGASLGAISKAIGITKQRVHQILYPKGVGNGK